MSFEAEAPAFAPVKDIVRELILDTVPTVDQDNLLDQLVGERGRRTIVSAARAANIHPTKFGKLCHAAGIVETHFGIETVERDAAFKLARQSKESLGLKELAEYIGTDRVMTKIIADRYTSKLTEDDEGSIKLRLDRNSVDEFIRKITSGATSTNSAPEGFYPIQGAAKRSNRAIHEVIDLILAGKLNQLFALENKSGFAGLLVNAEEVRALTQGPQMKGSTIGATGKRFGVSPLVIGKLVEHGYLETAIEINPLNRCPMPVVMPKTANTFFKEFVICAKLAKEMSINPKALIKLMRIAGNEPAFPPEIVGTYIYRRTNQINFNP